VGFAIQQASFGDEDTTGAGLAQHHDGRRRWVIGGREPGGRVYPSLADLAQGGLVAGDVPQSKEKPRRSAGLLIKYDHRFK
jgi:hypothetical protein